jgi:hypothetical protein
MKMAPSNKDGRCKYKYVCFDCKVSFKDKAECPTCRQVLTNVGSKFPVPPKRSTKRWAVLEIQYLNRRLTQDCLFDSKTVKEANSNFSKTKKFKFDHRTDKYSKWGSLNRLVFSGGY